MIKNNNQKICRFIWMELSDKWHGLILIHTY